MKTFLLLLLATLPLAAQEFPPSFRWPLRYRALDYRIYFEKTDDGITVQRVLHKNTIRDFLFRAKLPMPQEDEQLSQKKEFWKLIEDGERTRTR